MARELSRDHLFFGMGHTMTDEQWEYAQAIYSDKYDIIFCNSSAGTGKTTLAVAVAKLLVSDKSCKKDSLLYVFNPVEEAKMGFRPGEQHEKEREYTIPLKQALIEINEQPDKAIIPPMEGLGKKKSEGWVEATSHVFARGTNQKNRVVIIDEAQNWTIPELRKMITRCHDNCKVIVIGHDAQCDLGNPNLSGYVPYIEHFKDMPRAAICKLTKNFRGWLATHADKI